MNNQKRNKIIELYYSQGLSYKMVGEAFLLSKQRIKQIIDSSPDKAEIIARNRYNKRFYKK